MFWTIYILSSLVVSFFISAVFKKEVLRILTFFFTLVFLTTPTRVEIQYETVGPAVFVFLFDLIFAGNISEMSLRPLMLSLSLVLFISGVTIFIKKRFF